MSGKTSGVSLCAPTGTRRTCPRFGAALAFVACALCSIPASAANWPMFGQNPQNTASQDGESKISAGNVGTLAVKWSAVTTGDVSARAAVVNGVVYFPDWGPPLNPALPSVTGTSTLWALNADTGAVLWSRRLSDYALPANTHARTSPAVANGTLFIGTQEGAWLLAIDAATGALRWKTQLESVDPFAIVTSSPVVVGNSLYTGVASTAEAGTLSGITVSDAARGSVVAVNAKTGEIRWKTYTVPLGYTGGGVWGSNLAVDDKRNTLFASTGNNYSNAQPYAPSSVPNKSYGQCIGEGGTSASCASPDNHVDSVLALDLGTGAIKWARKLVVWNQFYARDGSDDWNVDCLWPALGFPTAGPQCPSNTGPDYDFASAPNLITYRTASGPKTILGAGQKSGIYYAFDPDTGALLWQTQVAAGSALGGMEWGSASDGKRIYVQNANLYGINGPGGSAGSWAALDPATGAVLWQTADPNGAIDIGPMTVANGVVFAASMGGRPDMPTMHALNAATGASLWSFQAGASVNAGATVVNGTVYWGAGYAHLGFPGQTGGVNRFYAFTLGGN
jgi:polyvinyl alcohol dehydrogenase (cytochrome)